LSKFIVFKSVDDMPEMAVSRGSMSWNKTGSWRSFTPIHRDKIPPCNYNCPAGEDIRGYIDLIKKNKVAEAFALLTETNPFPAVCGRVCFHPCQADCNRHGFDIEIQVRLLEKFIGDWAIENKKKSPLRETTGKKIAVVGAGPAGLAAAYYLHRKNLAVTVYDENHLPGGILHYGIPSYRLAKDVLQAEIGRVLRGIEFKANMRFGSDFDIGDLLDYDAVFLATGAHLSKKLNITGEHYPAVESGLDFLKRVNSGDSFDLEGKQVVVIGGGNTACDTARTAYRLGAAVSLVYRRTEKEMPAFAEEVEQLKSEPIEVQFLAAPQRIDRDDRGKLKVTFSRMKLGEPDRSGRARPVPIKDSNFEISADTIFTAIGEDPNLSFFPEVRTKDDGSFDFSGVDQRLGGKLFVGGDILPQPRTVPHAVASGRLAAEKIAAFLRGETLAVPQDIAEIAGPEDINYSYFTRVNRARWKSDLTVDGSLVDRDMALKEADRCFSCGVCSRCDNCYNFCPDLAVIRTPDGYQVNLDYCKGCGICVKECPGGSLVMEKSKTA